MYKLLVVALVAFVNIKAAPISVPKGVTDAIDWYKDQNTGTEVGVALAGAAAVGGTAYGAVKGVNKASSAYAAYQAEKAEEQRINHEKLDQVEDAVYENLQQSQKPISRIGSEEEILDRIDPEVEEEDLAAQMAFKPPACPWNMRLGKRSCTEDITLSEELPLSPELAAEDIKALDEKVEVAGADAVEAVLSHI